MTRLNKMIIAVFGRATEKACALKTDERGASALEFAIFAGILAFGLLNTADVSIYIYKRMQVRTPRKWRRRLPGRLVIRP
jgi:Flp pilus assembly protein TadG